MFAAAALLENGCASTPKTVQAQPGARVLTKDEYVYVNVTGSMIPVLVPKDKSIVPLDLVAQNVTTMSVDSLDDALRRGRKVSVSKP